MPNGFILALLGSALLLGACGAPAAVNDAANQAATAVSAPTTIATPAGGVDLDTALNEAGTAMADPTTAAMLNEVATAVTSPDVATAVSEATGVLSAAAENVTVEQGQALVLNATKSTGDIKDYKWTITKAPAGAQTVVGQVIKEGSSGNVSLEPADYAKYFPTAGTYTVQLTVTDAVGKTATDDFEVMVP